MKVHDINLNNKSDPIKNKTDKLPVNMDVLFTPPKTRPINITCQQCHARMMLLKQQATKLFVIFFLQANKHSQDNTDTTGFYKGRVLDQLSLPPQTAPEWDNGQCKNCETTEEQLKVGAVNIIRDHETRLTNALKSVKSERKARGYRSDSHIGPSSAQHKKHRPSSRDKISNLHKSTDNLKSNYVELAAPSAAPSAAPCAAPSAGGHHKISNCPGVLRNPAGTTQGEHAYANLSSTYLPGPPGAPQQNGYSKPQNTREQKEPLDGGIWKGPEPSLTPSPIADRSHTEPAPLPPKRSDTSRFSSRLKRKKESKTASSTSPPTTPSTTPSTTPDNKPSGGSFFSKASQMFRKRKKERPLTYAELIRLFAPPPPPALLRAYHTEGGRSSENNLYNVKIGMRISPSSQSKESILSVDETLSTVLIANETLFFDYVHGPQSKQIDVCSSMMSDVLPAILHGRSVVVVTFGTNSLGRQYTLIGSRDSTQSLGLVPTAVTWLNKLGDDDRSKCGPNNVHVTSLRLDEQKSLSEFVSPATISKSDDLGKYLDKLTLTLPAREHPNDEALIINMTFSKSKSKKKNKDNYGMLTFIDIGTPIRKNDSSNVLCWQWLQDATQTMGNKYFETFVQLRHNLMKSTTHVVGIGHITHSPRDYQSIGITLNLATRLYMRHLPAAKRTELQRLKREKDYSSATSTGEESADTVIYRPGLASDGEGPPKSYLPERTKGDGQEKSPQFCGSNKRAAVGRHTYSDTESRGQSRGQSRGGQSRGGLGKSSRLVPRSGGYHSETGTGGLKRSTGYSSDNGGYKSAAIQSYTRPAPQSGPSRPRQYALTDTEDHLARPGPRPGPLTSDTEQGDRRRAAVRAAPSAEDIRQKRVQKNQQQLKRYFELLRLKNQREAILQQSREMRGTAGTPEQEEMRGTTGVPEQEIPGVWAAENPAKAGPIKEEGDQNEEKLKENEDEVTLRTRTRSESRGKDNRRLYTIYDTEDDGAVLDQYLEEPPRRRVKGGYKSDSGVRSQREKTEISKEWLSKIKKKRQVPPGGKYIDYGPVDGPAAMMLVDKGPQVREVKPKRVKSSMSEDEVLTRTNLSNRDLRYSDRRLDKRSGYSTDAPSAPAARPKVKPRSSGYQSDGPGRGHRHRQNRHCEPQGEKVIPGSGELDLDELLEEVEEIEQLVQHKMQWRGALQDLNYFDQQIRILERRNTLIEKLRRKQFGLLSELQSTKNHLMSNDWKPDLTVDSSLNENSPGYLLSLWKQTSQLEIRLNTCKSKILVETSFM